MDHQVRSLFHELIDLPPVERRRMIAERQIAPEIRAELELLLQFDSPDNHQVTACVSGIAEEMLDSVAASDTECGPYRLIRLLGRGGMGAVYLGERTDGEIQQTVAVKLLNPGDHRPGWRARFLQERQFLASLNHPSIVHVIDAGHTADGRPYLVMEYVDGSPIDVYAAQLDFGDRLLLFLRVCEGVSHAHRRLIIHRDLKPSNILVDASGRPKLMDFGIAKLLHETGDTTQTVDRLLTPLYASPEQFHGVSQTTSTDIYSLGAVLYKILTGRSPHETVAGTSNAPAIYSGADEIPDPSRLNPRLPSDLDYILRRALRVEPEERYPSVDAFAADVRAFLESRPIEARAADIWYRARKFLLRRWIPVTAAMLVLASLSAGLFIANRQRLLAEARFAQLRQISNKVFDLDKAIRDLPGSTQARQTLVSDSLEYLEGLAGAARGDLDLTRELGQGYWRVARIQGVPVELNLGERAKAEASLKKAGQFVGGVLAARPTDRDSLYLAAAIANDRMVLAMDEHRYKDALLHAQESARRLDAFLAPGNAREAERAEAAKRYGNVAITYVRRHRYQDALPYARRELELVASLPSGRPPENIGLVPLIDAMSHGDLRAAVLALQQAYREAVAAVFPSGTMRQNELHGLLVQQGMLLGGDGELNVDRSAEAIRVFQAALELAEDAARHDLKDATSRVHAARAGIALADILRHTDPRKSLAAYDLATRRLSDFRTSRPAQRDRALALSNSSYPLRSLGRTSEAGQRIDAALAILQGTGDYPSDRYDLDGVIPPVLCSLADQEADAGDPRAAIITYEQLLNQLQVPEPAVDPQNPTLPDFEDSPKLSRIYEGLARLYRHTGETAKAESVEARRLALWQYWERQFPGNPDVHRQIETASR